MGTQSSTHFYEEFLAKSTKKGKALSLSFFYANFASFTCACAVLKGMFLQQFFAIKDSRAAYSALTISTIFPMPAA